ncbi:MAG: aldehyde dehydrogenase [Cyclobacteriaceae bacterium]|nr:aldehyde dehydrogenase [Cyclobacteriaceae bacterium]
MTHTTQTKAPVSDEKLESISRISEVFQEQKKFFNTQKTKDVSFRIEQLRNLKAAILAYEDRIGDAMYTDLKRSKPLTYYTEIGLSLKSISMTLNNIRKWAKPKRVKASHDMYPLSKCWVQYEPFGIVLLISPWNYPITLTMGPLTAALSAGNCAILKPSEISPNVSQVIAEMISEYYDEEYIAVVQGDAKAAQELLKHPFDHIMYTGGTRVGKIVMEAASKNLTPVTLELGGKSPAIVDQQIDMSKSAKRIISGKYWNCGQTCIAPDHLFVHEKIATPFIEELKKWIVEFYGKDPHESQDYGKIVSQKHFDRVRKYLADGKIIYGGKVIEEDFYISPTLMTEVDYNSPLMQEEIFGPILPIFTYNNIDSVLEIIQKRPKPLALYLFTNNPTLQQKVLSETSSGGVAINDCVNQFVSMNLPFGGVGNSGIGRYHGKYGFETFSHHRGVLKQTNLLDLKMKYPPVTEKSIKMLKMVLK